MAANMHYVIDTVVRHHEGFRTVKVDPKVCSQPGAVKWRKAEPGATSLVPVTLSLSQQDGKMMCSHANSLTLSLSLELTSGVCR